MLHDNITPPPSCIDHESFLPVTSCRVSSLHLSTTSTSFPVALSSFSILTLLSFRAWSLFRNSSSMCRYWPTVIGPPNSGLGHDRLGPHKPPNFNWWPAENVREDDRRLGQWESLYCNGNQKYPASDFIGNRAHLAVKSTTLVVCQLILCVHSYDTSLWSLPN